MKQNFITLQYELSAFVGAGTSLLGDIFNLFGSSKANQEQRDYNTNVIEKQRQWALQDIKDQNMYNSPAEQMNRLKQAGLNPNMVYGQGVQGATGSQQQQPKQTSIPSYNPVNIMGAFADMGRQMAQAVATLAGTRTIAPTVANIEQSTQTARENELRTKAERALLEIEKTYKDLYGAADAESASEKLRGEADSAQTRAKIDDIERYVKSQSKDATIQETIQGAKRIALENESDPIRVKILNRQFEILGQNKELNDWDLQSKTWNFNANSPIWQQVIMKILDFIFRR